MDVERVVREKHIPFISILDKVDYIWNRMLKQFDHLEHSLMALSNNDYVLLGINSKTKEDMEVIDKLKTAYVFLYATLSKEGFLYLINNHPITSVLSVLTVVSQAAQKRQMSSDCLFPLHANLLANISIECCASDPSSQTQRLIDLLGIRPDIGSSIKILKPSIH